MVELEVKLKIFEHRADQIITLHTTNIDASDSVRKMSDLAKFRIQEYDK